MMVIRVTGNLSGTALPPGPMIEPDFLPDRTIVQGQSARICFTGMETLEEAETILTDGQTGFTADRRRKY